MSSPLDWRSSAVPFAGFNEDSMDSIECDEQATTPVFNRDSPLTDGSSTPKVVFAHLGGLRSATPPGTPKYHGEAPNATPRKPVTRNAAKRAEMASTRKSSFADLTRASEGKPLSEFLSAMNNQQHQYQPNSAGRSYLMSSESESMSGEIGLVGSTMLTSSSSNVLASSTSDGGIALRPSGVLKRRDSGFLSRLPSGPPEPPLHRQNSEKLNLSARGSGPSSMKSVTSSASSGLSSSSTGRSGCVSAPPTHNTSTTSTHNQTSANTASYLHQAPSHYMDPTPQKVLKMNHNPYTPPTTSGGAANSNGVSGGIAAPHLNSASSSSYYSSTFEMSVPINSASRYLMDFQTENTLGRGSYGCVELARHRMDGWSYAIKRVDYRSKTMLDTVMNEVFMLASLAHPHIVRYHSAWIEETVSAHDILSGKTEVCIQMEYCYGGSLTNWWKQWLAQSGVSAVLPQRARSLGFGNYAQNQQQQTHQNPNQTTPTTTPTSGGPGKIRPNFAQQRPHPIIMSSVGGKGMSAMSAGGGHGDSNGGYGAFGFGPVIPHPDEATIANAVQKVESKLCEVLTHCCKALQYLHEEKYVVHLDVKPDNIFVQQETLSLETATFKLGDAGSMRKIPAPLEMLDASQLMENVVSLRTPRMAVDGEECGESTPQQHQQQQEQMAEYSSPTLLRAHGHNSASLGVDDLSSTPSPSPPRHDQLRLSTPPFKVPPQAAPLVVTPPSSTQRIPPQTPHHKSHHAPPNSAAKPGLFGNRFGAALETISSVPSTPAAVGRSNFATPASVTQQHSGTTPVTPLMTLPQTPLHLPQQTQMMDGDDVDGDGRYLAPELLEMQVRMDLLPKADMYALGCSIIELAHVALRSVEFQQQMQDVELDVPEALSASFKELLSMLTHPDPECRPTAAQILEHELLQSPHELHMKRELRRLEEKLKEVERQRDAALQSLAVCSSSIQSGNNMQHQVNQGFGNNNNFGVGEWSPSSQYATSTNQMASCNSFGTSAAIGSGSSNGGGAYFSTESRTPSPASNPATLSRSSTDRLRMTRKGGAQTPPPPIDASSTPTMVRASPNGFTVKFAHNGQSQQQSQRTGSPLNCSSPAMASCSSSSSGSSFGSQRSSPVNAMAGIQHQQPQHTPSPTNKPIIATLPLHTVPLQTQSSPSLFAPRASLAFPPWRMESENTRN